ncbi:hypothetical protein BDR05DRAFT_1006390 [Suillus weaverae]|nr:hypothetical protein BDR05DRAFT_1006390 [Suillus weaverae]
MPPKAGTSCNTKNATSAKHTKITKKRPPRKNPRMIKKPGKNTGLNPSLNSDASQVSISAKQPQPPVSYSELILLIDLEDMDEDSQEDEMEEDGEMEEDEFFWQQGSSRDYHHQPFMQPLPHPQQFQQPDLSFQQPGPSQDYHHQQSMQPIPCPQQFQQPDLSFRQPGPSQDHYYQQFRQPSPHLLLDSQHFQQPDLGWDYQQSWNPTLQQDHQQPLQPAPFPFIPPELESRKAQQLLAFRLALPWL